MADLPGGPAPTQPRSGAPPREVRGSSPSAAKIPGSWTGILEWRLRGKHSRDLFHSYFWVPRCSCAPEALPSILGFGCQLTGLGLKRILSGRRSLPSHTRLLPPALPPPPAVRHPHAPYPRLLPQEVLKALVTFANAFSAAARGRRMAVACWGSSPRSRSRHRTTKAPMVISV